MEWQEPVKSKNLNSILHVGEVFRYMREHLQNYQHRRILTALLIQVHLTLDG